MPLVFTALVVRNALSISDNQPIQLLPCRRLCHFKLLDLTFEHGRYPVLKVMVRSDADAVILQCARIRAPLEGSVHGGLDDVVTCLVGVLQNTGKVDFLAMCRPHPSATTL